jgi:NAD(P)-dependent dehydrogenase (short-subunit alcohol dehydrogenase family)
MIEAFVPLMQRHQWGRIVNVSSGAGSLTSMGAGTPAYSTSKAALNALTQIVAAELRTSGILVNAVCPGWVATDMGRTGGKPVEEGAAGVVWAATLPDGGPTGGFSATGGVSNGDGISEQRNVVPRQGMAGQGSMDQTKEACWVLMFTRSD